MLTVITRFDALANLFAIEKFLLPLLDPSGWQYIWLLRYTKLNWHLTDIPAVKIRYRQNKIFFVFFNHIKAIFETLVRNGKYELIRLFIRTNFIRIPHEFRNRNICDYFMAIPYEAFFSYRYLSEEMKTKYIKEALNASLMNLWYMRNFMSPEIMAYAKSIARNCKYDNIALQMKGPNNDDISDYFYDGESDVEMNLSFDSYQIRMDTVPVKSNEIKMDTVKEMKKVAGDIPGQKNGQPQFCRGLVSVGFTKSPMHYRM